ncbi:transposase [Paenibacillus polymyxa]|nr:transposase [Paenibacillus polymyxa]
MGSRSDVFAPSTKITRRSTTQKPSSNVECRPLGARTGAPWRDLPDYYGPWSSVYSFFWRLQKAGIWDEILKHVTIEPDFEQMMIDSTIVRVHQHGAGAKGGQQASDRTFPRRINHENPCRGGCAGQSAMTRQRACSRLFWR